MIHKKSKKHFSRKVTKRKQSGGSKPPGGSPPKPTRTLITRFASAVTSPFKSALNWRQSRKNASVAELEARHIKQKKLLLKGHSKNFAASAATWNTFARRFYKPEKYLGPRPVNNTITNA